MSRGIHRWWLETPGENLWLEVSRRRDFGANLMAPQSKAGGRSFWSYDLVNEVRSGDTVFHYDQTAGALIGASRATGALWADLIVWGARGASARKAGTKPHKQPGWYAALENYRPLSSPVRLGDIRQRGNEIGVELRSLESRVGSPLYFPFELGKREARPIQGYLFKLPSFFTNLFPGLADVIADKKVATLTKAPARPLSQLGAKYRSADEETTVGERDPFQIDPAEVERALKGHASTQNALAAFLSKKGIEPRSPGPDDPNFDLAWETGEETWVAEVKSLTVQNEEKQLRLGLGQVLRYRHLMNAARIPRAALVVERCPTDQSWLQLCAGLGVELMWPGEFQRLFEERA